MVINARRREIAIMRLVGDLTALFADHSSWKACLRQFIGALLAIAVLAVGVHTFLPVMAESLRPF